MAWLSNLSSYRMYSITRSQRSGKYGENWAEPLSLFPAGEYGRTFDEKRCGIFATASSEAKSKRRQDLCTNTVATPKNVQPSVNHNCVSARKRKNVMHHSHNHSIALAPQLVLW